MKNVLAAATVALVLVLADPGNAVGNNVTGDNTWSPPPAAGRARYESCIRKTYSDPAAAVLDARQWYISQRTDAARHCEAKALIGLSQYTEAAELLSDLALKATGGEGSLKGALFSQAGNAWLLANDPEAAMGAFNAAFSLLPGDPELLLDRARAWAELGQFDNAILDLDHAISIDPLNPDAFVFRSSARQVLEFHEQAMEDVEMALQILPDHPGALLERANIYLHREEPEKAQRDLLMILRLAPNTTLARAARQKLEPLLYE